MAVSRRGVLGAAGAAGAAGIAGVAGATAASAVPTSPASPATGAHGRAVIGPAGRDRLHVMSFNIRYDAGAAPGTPDSWTDRRPVLERFLRVEQPTVMGVQEALYHQVKQLDGDLDRDYDWIGLGREGGGRGEFMAVYFDTRRVEPLDYDHFWLSDTPNVIGSAHWGNTVIRMTTWVRFADRRTGKEFIHVNTHFDHRSENARQRGAALVRDRIADFDPALPVVLTGDFNTPAESSESYRVLVTEGGLADTWNTGERLTPAWGTFPDYQAPVEGGSRMDWVLANERVEVRRVAINTYTHQGRYPSDHAPVQALVRLV
ncbi:endonuclease/exonuclease/phosphatase family protein [Streptomyces radicis]|uniref:Endonuclease/exonuclease/phosphatase family protein n=1 Tax=Streptomyces radicis TaxID=1750517 RepID=A0A3A9WUW5_9ACTN|nr:endonuclease/exonuclease/phosphatase family protein [Streptomyces radicis]RKN11596.1 endonuclease/exonuclease/phosphatase family protein [Streptomyces radicis]RKN26385.1 endonuclease/exonuclease/phosphatase family protein [Streptomyces radicis]